MCPDLMCIAHFSSMKSNSIPSPTRPIGPIPKWCYGETFLRLWNNQRYQQVSPLGKQCSSVGLSLTCLRFRLLGRLHVDGYSVDKGNVDGLVILQHAYSGEDRLSQDVSSETAGSCYLHGRISPDQNRADSSANLIFFHDHSIKSNQS